VRHAIFHGYDFGGANPWLGYLVSALVGILAVGLVVYLIGMAAEAFVKRGSMDKV
jgi:cobalt/nickel transport system permease protein